MIGAPDKANEDGVELANVDDKKDDNEGGNVEEAHDFGSRAKDESDNLKISALRSETRPPASKVEVKREDSAVANNDDF